ncbi:MAG: hypothetical protein RJA36_1856 [Pseudomonadota bacterium]|jgi:hypothetical protein
MADLLTPVVIGLHLATAHFNAPADANLQAATPGIYMRSAAGLTLGAYRNSHARLSTYAAWTWTTQDQRWAITAGAVTGYPRASVYPLLVPSLRLPIKTLSGQRTGWAARLAYLPKPHSDGAQGLHLSVERGV